MDYHNFIFVTGLHRSGTSLLHRCLRRHPQISGFHDTGVPEDEGQHLQTVLPRGGAHGGPGRFGRHPEAHMTEAHPLALPETGAALFAQWRPYWDLTKPYLLEKTPITLLRTRLFQELFPISYFIVLLRHPAAVALATYNALASSGAVPDLTVADLIEHWLISHETFQKDISSLRRLMIIRYEDFAAEPQQTINAIYAFLGLPPCACGEEIEANINARYQAQWQAMSLDPHHQRDIERAADFEALVRGFGYPLHEWEEAAQPSYRPEKVMETERLLLRRFTFADVDSLAALYADAETMRFWDGPRPREQVWGEIKRFLEEYEQTGFSFWAVIHKAENRFIGQCGIQPQEVNGRSEQEVGYMIARPFLGQGLGTEAAGAVKEYVFGKHGFQRLISVIDPTNFSSIRVAEKNGMHYKQDAEMDGHTRRIYVADKPD